MKRKVYRHTPAPSYDPSYRNLPLTQELDAKVPSEIFDWLDQWNWCAVKKRRAYYAYRSRQKDDAPTPESIYLHTVVYELLVSPIPSGLTVDFANRDGFDCRLVNLRLATPQQQQWNKGCQSNSHTKLIGVSWSARLNKWTAFASENNVTKYLGLFDDPISAAWVRDHFIRERRSEFAVCNNPDERRAKQLPVLVERRQNLAA